MAIQDRRAVHVQAFSRLALLLAIPIAIGIVMWLVARLADSRAQWVEHTLQVEVSLERLASAIDTAEASGHGYLLTGEDKFLEDYNVDLEELRKDISTVAGLTIDNPSQQRNVVKLREELEARISSYQSSIDEYLKRKSDPSSMKAQIDQQRELLATSKGLIQEMEREEQRLLAARESALTTARSDFLGILVIGYAVIVLIVTSLYFSVRRHSVQSAVAEARLSRLNAELDDRVRERTALLKTREDLLNTFVRYVPAAVAMLDRNMRYVQVSDRWASAYRMDRSQFEGNSHYDLFPEIPERWKEIHRRCLAGETLRSEEDRWVRQDGRVDWLRWEIRPWGDHDHKPAGILIFAEDITARKELEESLRESEETVRTLLDTAAQAIVAIDSEGLIVLANRQAGKMFGYGQGELIGRHLEILIPERLRNQHQSRRQDFNLHPRSRAMGSDLDLLGVRKDGLEFPIEVSLSSVNTKRGLLAVSFISDITARKTAESALRESEQRLRALAARLLSAQEEERRNLARELHDDITQQLAFLSIELGRFATEFPEEAAPRKRIEELQQQASRISSEVRRISHGLHPSVITDFGLSIALEEFCGEFERGHGIAVVFDGLVEDSCLTDTEAACLYRIAQESLRNALVHGQAKKIRVTLQTVDDLFELKVQDNGVGFSVESRRSRAGLGILGMTERIRMVNGTLDITSRPGHGTSVTAAVPLHGEWRHESQNPSR